MRVPHRSYHQLLNGIRKIENYFEVKFLAVPNEKFTLVRFAKIIASNAPLVIIMAGCHGEEPAPSLAIFKNHRLLSEAAKRTGVNLVLYPLVNPWGFDRNRRLNRRGLNCNSDWICKERRNRVASEVKVITKDIKNFTPKIFASIHEDDETKREFYMFSFGDRKYEKPLIETGRRYFPILQDGNYGDLKIKNGVVHNHHDGSAEDFMSRRGCKFSCCTETPSSQPLSKRTRCNTDLMLKLIELSKM